MTTTILFTDLVDSTALSARIGDEAMDGLRRTHFAGLRDAITRCGGVEVKTIGDAVMVALNSVSSALDCAVAMQQAVDQQNRVGAGETLAMRVGLAVGEVTREDNDYFGVPVVEAARLCAKAKGGQILLSEMARLLAGTRGGHSFASVGELELKGLPDPVPACELRWLPLADRPALVAGIPPLPASFLSVERGQFVGRRDALARLEAAFGTVEATGRRRLTLVAGEPGIGKTRLVGEFCAGAHARGAVVLFGRCDEEALLTFQPIVELLRHYIAHCDVDALHQQLGRGGADIARIVPELAELLPVGNPLGGDPETERYRLFDAVATLLDNVSQLHPLIVVLDDLHWADKPTLLLLRHLVRRPDAARIHVVGTYRETDLDRQHPLTEVLADLRREAGHERILLRGLDEAETEALLQVTAPHDPSPASRALAHALQRETEGNPFFLHEVVRHFKETGKIFERDGQWTTAVASLDELGIPEGVKEVVGRRLSRLSADCQGVLSKGAVQGRDFDLAVLERVTEWSGDQVIDLLDEAIAAGLVEALPQPDHYRFGHALVREALYSELTISRRVRLHRQVGEALEALGAAERSEQHAELAFHFCCAAPGGDVNKALGYSLLAANQAKGVLAFEAVLTVCRRALDVVEGERHVATAARAELFTLLAEATLWLGDARGAGPIADRALALMDDASPSGLYYRAAWVHYTGTATPWGIADQANIDLLEEALRRLGEHEPRLTVDAHRWLSVLYAGARREEASAAHLDRAIAVAEDTQDATLSAEIRITIAQRHLDRREHAAARQSLEEAVELANRLHDPTLLAEALFFLGVTLFQQGDLDAYRDHLQAFDVAAREAHNPLYMVVAEAGYPAALAWMDGNADRFDALNGAYRDRTEQLGLPTQMMIAAVQRIHQRLDQGRIAEVTDDVDRWCNPFARFPDFMPAIGLIRLGAGDPGAAADVFDALAADGFAFQERFTQLSCISHAVELCARVGGRDHAAGLYERALPFAGLNAELSVPVFCFGSASRGLGMLAGLMERYDDAERHFRDALAQNTRMGNRPAVAKTLAAYATMVVSRGGPDDRLAAHELARRALAEAESMGMTPTAEEARAVLAS